MSFRTGLRPRVSDQIKTFFSRYLMAPCMEMDPPLALVHLGQGFRTVAFFFFFLFFLAKSQITLVLGVLRCTIGTISIAYGGLLVWVGKGKKKKKEKRREAYFARFPMRFGPI